MVVRYDLPTFFVGPPRSGLPSLRKGITVWMLHTEHFPPFYGYSHIVWAQGVGELLYRIWNPEERGGQGFADGRIQIV
jgi:hypothetical protein